MIDPTKVVQSCLQNASSIASLLLTTEAVISQIPEKHPNGAASRCRTDLSRATTYPSPLPTGGSVLARRRSPRCQSS